jgi:hypothetical protein
MISNNGLRLSYRTIPILNIWNYLGFAFVRSRRGSKKRVIGKIPTIMIIPKSIYIFMSHLLISERRQTTTSPYCTCQRMLSSVIELLPPAFPLPQPIPTLESKPLSLVQKITPGSLFYIIKNNFTFWAVQTVVKDGHVHFSLTIEDLIIKCQFYRDCHYL